MYVQKLIPIQHPSRVLKAANFSTNLIWAHRMESLWRSSITHNMTMGSRANHHSPNSNPTSHHFTMVVGRRRKQQQLQTVWAAAWECRDTSKKNTQCAVGFTCLYWFVKLLGFVVSEGNTVGMVPGWWWWWRRRIQAAPKRPVSTHYRALCILCIMYGFFCCNVISAENLNHIHTEKNNIARKH